VVGFDFVDYDDREYVTDNVEVRRGLGWETIRWAATAQVASHWHPLTMLSHALDWTLFGAWAGGHHATNVLLHVLNVLLLFGFLVRSTDAPGRSALVAALFALHPLRVESVAWVAERKDVLSAAFFLGTLHAYVGWIRRPSVARYVAVAALFAAGLLAKSMVLTLPLVLLALDVWPLGRREPLGRRVLEKLPLLALSVASGLVTLAVARDGAMAGLAYVPLPHRLANAVVSLAWYLTATLWPSRLAVLYMHPYAPGGSPLTWVQLGGATLLVAAISVWVWRERRRGYPVTGWAWFLILLLPVLGLVQAGIQARADRYTYLALIGPVLVVVWRLADWLDERAAGATARRLVAAASVCLVIGCAVAARAQLAVWRDPISLYRHAIAVEPNNFMMHYNLGTQLNGAKRYDDALAAFRRAEEIHPSYSWTKRAIGEELERRGRLDDALPYYRETVRILPGEATHQRVLADALLAGGDAAGAIEHYRLALALAPDEGKTHNNYGNALLAAGDVAGARAAYERALALDPSQSAAHGNLAARLEADGRWEEALVHRRESVRLAPDSADARQALAVTELRLGDEAAALATLREAARLAPERADIAQLAAWALAARADATRADGEEAVRLARRAVGAADPPEALSLTTLAVAEATAGRFADASAAAARARERAVETGETDLVQVLDVMREAFARNERYHE
jgi:tetratricopeptide (TPR) repeat protein